MDSQASRNNEEQDSFPKIKESHVFFWAHTYTANCLFGITNIDVPHIYFFFLNSPYRNLTHHFPFLNYLYQLGSFKVLPTKVHLVKAMVFPVVMYGCESWSVKKVEHRRIDAFELQCWKRLLRVPWTARRFIQSTLKEISPECSLEGLILKLKLQYFGHLMRRFDSLEKTLMPGGIGGRWRRGWQRMRQPDWHHQLNGHEFW